MIEVLERVAASSEISARYELELALADMRLKIVVLVGVG